MRTRLFVGVAILLAFFLGGLYAEKSADNLCRPISQTLEKASQAALDNQLNTAAELTEQAKEKWENSWNRLAVLADHSPMDEIDGLFAQAKMYMQIQAKEDFAATCSRLAQLISAISDAHRLTWWNLV